MIVLPVNTTFDHGSEINIRTVRNCLGQNQ
jgi:hypothetical protein